MLNKIKNWFKNLFKKQKQIVPVIKSLRETRSDNELVAYVFGEDLSVTYSFRLQLPNHLKVHFNKYRLEKFLHPSLNDYVVNHPQVITYINKNR